MTKNRTSLADVELMFAASALQNTQWTACASGLPESLHCGDRLSESMRSEKFLNQVILTATVHDKQYVASEFLGEV